MQQLLDVLSLLIKQNVKNGSQNSKIYEAFVAKFGENDYFVLSDGRSKSPLQPGQR